MDIRLSKNQIHCMRHAVAGNYSGESYRNNFITGPGWSDYSDMDYLVEVGFATKTKGPFNDGDYIFCITDDGLKFMRDISK